MVGPFIGGSQDKVTESSVVVSMIGFFIPEGGSVLDKTHYKDEFVFWKFSALAKKLKIVSWFSVTD